MVIRAYHQSRGQGYRNVVLIPASAHGTNPASAAMAGMKIVTVACDATGNIDVEDLKAKAREYSSELCGLMVTYPSTHGVFESRIREIVDAVHDAGGQVYMDGANMNAQVGLTNPGYIGADVCHLNLHKTFAMPHGGGGPGVGPILRRRAPQGIPPLASGCADGRRRGHHGRGVGPVGLRACCCPITYGYIKMLGGKRAAPRHRNGDRQCQLHVVGAGTGVPHLLFGRDGPRGPRDDPRPDLISRRTTTSTAATSPTA